MRRPTDAPRPFLRVPTPVRLELIAAIALVIAASGCATSGSIEPLQVTLADLEVSEVTVFETTLLARLRITNPNPEPFTIDGASFKLTLEDKKVGSGTTPETFTVERLDSTVVDAVFHINNASALLRLKSILEQKSVNYGITGSLFTQGTFGTKKIRIDKAGRLDLEKVPSPETEGPEKIAPPPSG